MAELLLELFSEEIPARMQARAREDLARLLGARSARRGSSLKRSGPSPRRAGSSRWWKVCLRARPMCARSAKVRASMRLKPRSKASSNPRASNRSTRPSSATTRRAITTSQRSRSRPLHCGSRGRDRAGDRARFPLAEIDALGERQAPLGPAAAFHLCLLDGKVVPFEIDGVKSGKETRGHRFMAPKPFDVKGLQGLPQETAQGQRDARRR